MVMVSVGLHKSPVRSYHSGAIIPRFPKRSNRAIGGLSISSGGNSFAGVIIMLWRVVPANARTQGNQDGAFGPGVRGLWQALPALDPRLRGGDGAGFGWGRPKVRPRKRLPEACKIWLAPDYSPAHKMGRMAWTVVHAEQDGRAQLSDLPIALYPPHRIRFISKGVSRSSCLGTMRNA